MNIVFSYIAYNMLSGTMQIQIKSYPQFHYKINVIYWLIKAKNMLKITIMSASTLQNIKNVYNEDIK